MKKLILLLLLLNSFSAYSKSDYEELWHSDSPFFINYLVYSPDYNWAVIMNYTRHCLVLGYKENNFTGTDTVDTGFYPYFSKENLLISMDFDYKILYTYNPTTKEHKDYYLDYVDPAYSHVIYFSEKYVAYYDYKDTACILYDIQKSKLLKKFCASEGTPISKIKISDDNSSLIGLSANKLIKYDIINEKIDLQTELDIPEYINCDLLFLNDSLAAIITQNSFYCINLKNGNIVLNKDVIITNYFYFDKTNLELYYQVYGQNSSNYFEILNVINGSVSAVTSESNELTDKIKIVNNDTLFYSDFRDKNAYTKFLTKYNLRNSVLDTICKYNVNDSIFGFTLPKIMDMELYDSLFYHNYNFYSIKNKSFVHQDLVLPSQYFKYDEHNLYYISNDSTLKIIDLLTLQAIDSIKINSFEQFSSFYFSEDKKYLLSSSSTKIRKVNEVEYLYTSKNDEKLNLFDFNSDYFLVSEKLSTNPNGYEDYKYTLLSFDDESTFKDFQTYSFNNLNYPILLRDNSKFIYYNALDSAIHFNTLANGSEEKISLLSDYRFYNMYIDSANQYLAVCLKKGKDSTKIEIYNILTKEIVISFENSDDYITNFKINNNFSYLLMDFFSLDLAAYKLNLEYLAVENNYKSNCILSLYPNPTANNLNISSTEIIKNISIYDVNGNCIYKSNDINSESYTQDINSLTAGTYYLKADIGKVKVSKSFVVNR